MGIGKKALQMKWLFLVIAFIIIMCHTLFFYRFWRWCLTLNPPIDMVPIDYDGEVSLVLLSSFFEF
jgi:hypothetical protein